LISFIRLFSNKILFKKASQVPIGVMGSSEKTGVIAAVVGNANNGVCSKGVAYGAKFAQKGGSDVFKDRLFSISLFESKL
jgi:hypothetical protein